MTIKIPENANLILNTLNKAGYEAYVVGGCVRDAILGREPGDWDITTSALPEQVKELFEHTIDTGLQHGTVTVMLEHVGYEITTYRVDGKYSDGRHPDAVTFTPSLREDLKRRDFTINAMAYNPATGIVDLFNGEEDLRSGVIRCVGTAEDRFNEDALRILRAARFSAQLGFEIDSETQAACKKLAVNLRLISRERIQVELDKLLCSSYPERANSCMELGILDVIFEDAIGMQEVSALVKPSILNALKESECEHFIRWAVFLSALTADAARAVLKSLKFDNNTIKTVSQIIKYLYGEQTEAVASHNVYAAQDAYSVRKLLSIMGLNNYKLLLKVQIALGIDNNEAAANLFVIEEQKHCYQIKDLAVDGKDLQAAGIPQGERLGATLSYLLAEVLKDPSLNTKDALLKMALK